MNLNVVNELYNQLVSLANQAFDIVFKGVDLTKEEKVNKVVMHKNMDQYLQCSIIKCVLTDKIIPGSYLGIVKELVQYDAFKNIEAIENFSTDDENYISFEKYINDTINTVPLFISLITHLDATCRRANPNFENAFSKRAFACVVEIIRNTLEEKLVQDELFPSVLFNVLEPIINVYKANNLEY